MKLWTTFQIVLFSGLKSVFTIESTLYRKEIVDRVEDVILWVTVMIVNNSGGRE